MFCAFCIITGLGFSGIFLILPDAAPVGSFYYISNAMAGAVSTTYHYTDAPIDDIFLYRIICII